MESRASVASRASWVLALLVLLIVNVAPAWAGWYLLVPPLEFNPQSKVAVIRDDVPLNRWNQVGEFDSTSACHTVQRERLHEADTHPIVDVAGGNIAALLELASRCIATDDPRLR